MSADYTEKDLIAEIEEIINFAEHAVPQSWIATKVMSNHKDIRGTDKDFYELCAWANVKRVIHIVIRKLEPSPDVGNPQFILPGFDRIQTHYPIERDGEPCVVPINEMTNTELEIKAQEYEAIAAGCLEHAKEIRRYIRERKKYHPA